MCNPFQLFRVSISFDSEPSFKKILALPLPTTLILLFAIISKK